MMWLNVENVNNFVLLMLEDGNLCESLKYGGEIL
jgi:hypothetical protein